MEIRFQWGCRGYHLGLSFCISPVGFEGNLSLQEVCLFLFQRPQMEEHGPAQVAGPFVSLTNLKGHTAKKMEAEGPLFTHQSCRESLSGFGRVA